jgi:hypothetical protein
MPTFFDVFEYTDTNDMLNGDKYIRFNNCTFLRDIGDCKKGQKIDHITLDINIQGWNSSGLVIDEHLLL